MPSKFRKKPVVVEAMRYDTPESCLKIHEWMGLHHSDDYLDRCGIDPFSINTLEGRMEVAVGDWVIKGVAGEFYPCKPDIFEATYERVSDEA